MGANENLEGTKAGRENLCRDEKEYRNGEERAVSGIYWVLLFKEFVFQLIVFRIDRDVSK